MLARASTRRYLVASRANCSMGGRCHVTASISDAANTSENSTKDRRSKHPETLVDKHLYLHVGPSGDCWTGDSIFAAKHLQPDYVKSVKLDDETLNVDVLLELLEEEDGEEVRWTRRIYDEGVLPQELLDRLCQVVSERRGEKPS